MRTVLLDEVINTDYGQFDVGWSSAFGFDGHFDRFFAGQSNGLVGAADPDGVYVNLARRSGGSQVSIELAGQAPADVDAWEDVVEVSVTIPEGAHPRWSSWAGQEGGRLPIPPGTYRLRVSACGRDAGRDGEFADGVVDVYRLTLWPAPSQPDAIVRQGSSDARYWHDEIGGRQ